MSLPRTNSGVGAPAQDRPLPQLTVRRDSLWIAGRRPEPVVSAEQFAAAVGIDAIESFRPLLPVGYRAGVQAYHHAVAQLDDRSLTEHYTTGLEHFHQAFVPHLAATLADLSGGEWQLDDYVAFAAGSDVDLMTHVVEAIAATEPVHLYPGDWYGFLVGCTQTERIHWRQRGTAALTCLCVPSVRNGHLTASMVEFLADGDACLLNLNLYPTLVASERKAVARALAPLLPRALLSISFSRGFGLTASQLGVILVHRNHPLRKRFARQWSWLTYFHNRLAADAFMALDRTALSLTDNKRRTWVHNWLKEHDLPGFETGTYYVKSFVVEGDLPAAYDCLRRDDVVRLCFKPPQID